MGRQINYGSWDALAGVAAEYQTVIDDPGKYGPDGVKHKARADSLSLVRVYEIIHLVRTFTREQFEAEPRLLFLTWVRLSKIDDPVERAFYLHMTREEGWSTGELDRTVQEVRRVRRIVRLLKRFKKNHPK